MEIVKEVAVKAPGRVVAKSWPKKRGREEQKERNGGGVQWGKGESPS